LAYHHVDWRFRRHLPILRACGKLVSVREGVEALGRNASGRMLAVTFDDFYQEVHDYFCGQKVKLKLPTTAFVTTREAELGTAFWWDEVELIVAQAAASSYCWNNRTYALSTQEERANLTESIRAAWFSLPPSAIQNSLRLLRKSLGWYTADLPHELRPARWPQVAALSSLGVEIGSHTVTHPYLTSLSDLEARRELEQSKHELERVLGAPIAGIAYPFGGTGSYDDRIAGLTRDCGYQYAVTTTREINRPESDRFKLARSCVRMDESLWRVFLKAAAIDKLLLRFVSLQR